MIIKLYLAVNYEVSRKYLLHVFNQLEKYITGFSGIGKQEAIYLQLFTLCRFRGKIQIILKYSISMSKE
ncbi:protein of unknown function [Maridesulfovibrio hydrothermalis AM13 = DSM 14728]|uniref:Uncharacterized protein n=1 Tax=Maridesulfovibrio hydrothermalis AM13 = DSM 14728 TaxID=1121451 RepID=L0R8H4_9BACT|nr:protein of unknown function [Maridesulfovibrio hydrothermalis AM13 = DSM 14728]